MTADAPHERTSGKAKRRAITALIVVVALVVVWWAVKAFVGIETNLLWFRSVGHENVYARKIWTQVLLFGIFGGLMALSLTANLLVLRRLRPREFAPDPVAQRWRYRFQTAEPRLWVWLFVVIVGYLTVKMGSLATGSWQTWLAWRYAVPTPGQVDPHFHREISYYLFVYPMHRLVVTLLFRIVLTSLIAVVVMAYWYGGLRLRGAGPRISRAVLAQVSLLIGLYLVLKGFAYYLDRFASTTSNLGPVTGLSYTVVHAVLPSKLVLIVIAGICSIIMFVNVAVKRGRLLIIGVAVMVVSALLIGYAWPAVFQVFRERPSASQVEKPSIARNIAATTAAFGLTNVNDELLSGTQSLTGADLVAQAARTAQVRLLDPNLMSPTYNYKQQIESYYGFKSTLDIDRYGLGRQPRDVALAVRELMQSGLPNAQKTWTNLHLVYTHGNGVVSAPTTRFRHGLPIFTARDLPQTGLPAPEPALTGIYYGQYSPSYSIVGGPPGSAPREFNLPGTNGSSPTYSTYQGHGVPIGSLWHRLLYTVKLRSTSILFSSEINKYSQLLMVRNPRARVSALAPWLTLDGDTYPTVVDGHVLWVVDGYTTSNSYPNSQQINLQNATTNTLTKTGSTITQPKTSINYMRNSVKATVDAYTGQVTIYAWNQQAQPDPILATYERAFPGLVQPQSDIPSALLPHLRYPQDLFNVQRSLLGKYHVTNPADFYSGSNFWAVPTDPTLSGSVSKNSLGQVVTTSAPTQPSVYMSLSADGESAPATFSLSTPMVTLNARSLAAFISVDSQPGPDYGRITVLDVPPGKSIPSPGQTQITIRSNSEIAARITQLTAGSSSTVVFGNLLTIPLAGQMLYVEPIYTQTKGVGSTFPSFQGVVAVYGTNPPEYEPTLPQAIAKAIAPR
jgi:uncharacterized protein